ncbi:MAG: hypothetical protein ACRD18_14700 [Terriglobia bacterium]
MTYEQIEKIVGELASHMRQIEDAQVVQGVLEHRLERRIDGLAAMIEVTNQSVQSLSETTLVIGNAVSTLIEQAKSQEDRTAKLEDRTAELERSEITMRAAMEALFARMDRFIRGIEGNGHKQ